MPEKRIADALLQLIKGGHNVEFVPIPGNPPFSLPSVSIAVLTIGFMSRAEVESEHVAEALEEAVAQSNQP